MSNRHLTPNIPKNKPLFLYLTSVSLSHPYKWYPSLFSYCHVGGSPEIVFYFLMCFLPESLNEHSWCIVDTQYVFA